MWLHFSCVIVPFQSLFSLKSGQQFVLPSHYNFDKFFKLFINRFKFPLKLFEQATKTFKWIGSPAPPCINKSTYCKCWSDLGDVHEINAAKEPLEYYKILGEIYLENFLDFFEILLASDHLDWSGKTEWMISCFFLLWCFMPK